MPKNKERMMKMKHEKCNVVGFAVIRRFTTVSFESKSKSGKGGDRIEQQ